jgi:hypothetical protein
MRFAHYNRHLRFYYYHWVDISADLLLVSEGNIRLDIVWWQYLVVNILRSTSCRQLTAASNINTVKKPVSRGQEVIIGTKKKGPYKTGDLIKEVQVIWNFLWQNEYPYIIQTWTLCHLLCSYLSLRQELRTNLRKNISNRIYLVTRRIPTKSFHVL